MASKNDILTQASLEYEAAKRKGDKAGMVRAHAKADRARGAYTQTVVENGRYVQRELGKMSDRASSGELLDQTIKLNKPIAPLNPANFRNASPVTRITPEQQAANQATVIKELQGKDGNVASLARGFGIGLGTMGLSSLHDYTVNKKVEDGKLNPANAKYWGNPEQDEASLKNIAFSYKSTPNAQNIRMGFKPQPQTTSDVSYQGIGELAGSLIGVDPVAMVGGKLVKAGINRAATNAAKIPVLVNGKTVFVDAPTQGISKNVSAPDPRVIPKAQPETSPRPPVAPVQPISPQKGIEIPKEQPFVKNGDLSNVQKIPSAKFKDLGADTFKGKKTIEQLVAENGAIEKGMAPRRNVRNGVEIQVPNKTPYGEVSKFARTFQESKAVKDDLAKLMDEAILQGSATKTTVGNKTVVDNANDLINNSIDDAYTQFKNTVYSGKNPTSQDIALGARLVQELQNMGQNENALDIGLDMLDMLSEAGRTLQASQILKKLSPEGRLMSVARAAKKISKTIGGQKVTISDETMNMIRNAKTEGEIIRANQRAAIEMWEQVPANWGDKANAWRYTAMLFNPRTQFKNIFGNAMFVPVRYIKNTIGAVLEKAIIRNGDRTKSVLNVLSKDDRELMNFARNDFKNEMKDVLKSSGGGKLDNVYRPQEATVYGKGNLAKSLLNTKGAKAKIVSVADMYLQLFKKGQFGAIPGETMELIRRMNVGALDIEDTWFMQWAYDGSFAQYMKANRLKASDMTEEAMQRAREYAGQEALKATYRDVNSVANAISRAQRTLAKGSDKNGIVNFGMKSAGVAIEGLVPFKKTPLNIVKRGVAYSPANLIRGAVNMTYGVRTGKVTATEAIDQLASGITGTGLVALGVWLGSTGLVTGKIGEWSDKVSQYQEMLGQQNYSMNINGKSYTLDWAAPNSLPFFVGVEVANALTKEGTGTGAVANIIDAMTQISDPMINLSMLKGLNDLMTGYSKDISEKIATVATGYAGQYNPTLFGQIARTTDDVRRSTISTAETRLERTAEKFGRKQLAKIPIASQKLEPYIDLWGREQKSTGALENFLSPGYFKQENITPVDKELLLLVESLDKETAKKVIPSSTAYKYTIESNSVPYRLTEKESTIYQKTRGQESYKGLETLFASGKYSTMTDEEKVKAIGDVYDDAALKAKAEYFANKGLPVTLALSKTRQEKFAEIKPFGITDKQFYLIATTADTDNSGQTSTREFNIAMRNAGLTGKQRQAMILAYKPDKKK